MRSAAVFAAMVWGSPLVAQVKPIPNPRAVDFGRDIRPILAEKCFSCHGPDEKHVLGGLRLDIRQFAMGMAASGRPAIVPGRAEASPLVLRTQSAGPDRMPPPTSTKRLSAEEKRLLREWVAQGARYTEHWAFVAPVKPKLPRPPGQDSQPIDQFVSQRLREQGLGFSPMADRATLVRRASLDITGLPPTPDELTAAEADSSPTWYERLLDRLLASPRYGERWARPWLDLARFADSAGYGSDPLRPNLWPWRDWVINALNANMPYDQFTLEQLAGDLLPNPTDSQLIATAFHRNTMTNTEGGTDDEEFRMNAVKDRANTTAQVWMGLTMGCAQCHSHKFDPITNREYYRFAAFFNQTEDNDQPDDRPTLAYWTDDLKAKRAPAEHAVAELTPRASTDSEAKRALEVWKKDLEAIKPVAVPVMREVAADKRRTSTMLVLGNFLQKGPVVDPGTPAYFPAMPEGLPANRLGVARWLVDRRNPLTARVAVNRIWAQLFGKGLVVTEEDFGHQGARPTHPELLDWLAVDFMESGWNVKRLIKRIMLSQTYRQSSRSTPTLQAVDPTDTLLGRYPRRRLDAETVRDQALALSGLLSAKLGGPSVYPPQPEGMWKAAFNGERTWPTSTGEDRYRRGLYTFWRRTVPYPSMATFDAPSREICTVRRLPTNTPLQALVTLNDPAFVEMSQALARRVIREGGATTDSRVKWALSLVTCRQPNAGQVGAVTELLQSELARFNANPESSKLLSASPSLPLPVGMDPIECAAWTVVANTLLNLDSVMTKG